jgi:hypothetical protein
MHLWSTPFPSLLEGTADLEFQKFHSDLHCDILAFQTRGCAAVAGNHIITSPYKIYNELAMTRPDLLRVLASPEWTLDQ